jgi:hypothetical protein
MKEPKQQKILFFIEGAVPTPSDLAAAEALGTRCFRNARKATVPPRDCRVAGAVPANYAKSKNVTVVPAPQKAK